MSIQLVQWVNLLDLTSGQPLVPTPVAIQMVNIYFVYYWPKQAVEPTIEWMVMWDVMMLMWRHSDDGTVREYHWEGARALTTN